MKANLFLAGLALSTVFTSQFPAQAADDKLDRSQLPIAEPEYPHSKVLDARDAKAPPRFEVKPPKSAPNVVIVLIDDIGFDRVTKVSEDTVPDDRRKSA